MALSEAVKGANKLWKRWDEALKVARYEQTDRAWDDEQEVYTELCDYVDSVGLTYSPHDPRGNGED